MTGLLLLLEPLLGMEWEGYSSRQIISQIFWLGGILVVREGSFVVISGGWCKMREVGAVLPFKKLSFRGSGTIIVFTTIGREGRGKKNSIIF